MEISSEEKYQITVYNPLLILSLSWLSILFLYVSYPVGVLYKSNGLGITYLFILVCLTLLLSLFVGFKRNIFLDYKTLLYYSSKNVYTRIFFFFILIELALKGLPPIFTGADYTSWGISGLHGFINILGLFVSFWSFILFMLMKKGRRMHLIIIMMVFLWQILVLNRAIMMLNGIGLLYISICLKKIKFSHLLFAGFLMIYLMGLVGDLRGMGGNYINLITEPKPWAERLGVGFIWVVTYFTTAISNLMYNIEIGKMFAFQPSFFFNEFLPNIFKLSFSNNDEIKLYNEIFNATTLARPSLVSFGMLGPLFTFLLLIIFSYFYYSRRKTFQWVVFMTFFSAASVLSCYENTIFTPWVLFMFLLSIDFKLFKLK